METQEIHGQSVDESARHGHSVISEAVARAGIESSDGVLSTMNGQRGASTADRCPRCGKTIQAPMLLAHAKAEEYLIELIKRDHPEWVQPDGTCSRCSNYYRVLAQRTGV